MAIVALGMVGVYVARNVAFQSKSASSQPASRLGAGTNEHSGVNKLPLQGSSKKEPPALAIKILSPREGEKWRAGSAHTIRWMAPSEKVRAVNISVEFTVLCPEVASSDCKTERKSLEIARGVPNSGFYDWKVRQVGAFPKIHIEGLSEAGEMLARATSGEFKILSPPQTVVVEIGSTDVVPATAYLREGDAVQFFNNGKRVVHLTFQARTESPIPPGLEQPIAIPPHESYIATFPVAGEWKFWDPADANIQGMIVARKEG